MIIFSLSLCLWKQKVFESFNETIKESPEFRMPEQVSREEFDNKLRYDKVAFTKEEDEFFTKFIEKNNVEQHNYIFTFHGRKAPKFPKKHTKTFDIFNSDGLFLAVLEIIKLDDSWYLITDYYKLSVRRYICDEWEEVLGYLAGCHYNFKNNI